MSNVEQRLRAAAEESRQFAQTRRPVRIDERQTARPQGWLVFAAAFAIVAVTFGLIPLLTGGGEAPPVGDSTLPSVATETTLPTVETTSPPTTTPTAETVASACSSDGAPVPAAVSGLPEAVAATRNAIIEGASACDFAALEDIGGEDLITSLGLGGPENLRRWEDEGRGELGTLLHILDMSYATTETEDGGAIYAWPSATGMAWEDLDAEQIAELEAIHTQSELDMMAEAGSYMGWRAGIDQDGNWIYFVAGE